MKKIAVLEVLKVPAFRSLWLSQMFSQIALNLLTFVLALRVYDLTHRNTIVSVLALSFIIPQALFGFFAGVLVDRYDKKVVLFLCNFFRALAVLGFLLTRESIGFIYLLAIIVSIITQFFVPAEAPIIPNLVSKKDLLTANGVFTLTIFVTMMIGGILAGPMLTLFGIDTTFLIIFFMYIFAALFITKIPGQPISQALKRNLSDKTKLSLLLKSNLLGNGAIHRFKAEFSDGKNYILNHPRIITALFLLVGSQSIIASFSTLLPGFADSVLKIAINDASVLLLGPAIFGIVIGAMLISQIGERLNIKIAINAGIILVSLVLVALGFTSVKLAAQALLLFLGFSNALIDVSSNTVLQGETSKEIRSRVYGVLTSLGGLVFFFPIILSGAISDIFGVDKMFIFGGILIFIFWTATIRERVNKL